MSVARSLAICVMGALALACAAEAAAQARNVQLHAQARMGGPAESPGCEKAVKDYVNALRFIRETSGSGIAGRVEQAYLNESQVAQFVEANGYCATAQALRTKGAAVR